MPEYKPELQKQGFGVLMQRLIHHAQDAAVNNREFDFNDFDDMTPVIQERMIKFAYLLHLRIQIAIGTKQIHQSLTDKEERGRIMRELNRHDDYGPHQ